MKKVSQIGITLLALVLVLVLPLLVLAASPPFQEPTKFLGNVEVTGDVSVGDDLTVADDATVTGDLTVSGEADFSAATVSGISTSTLSSLTVTGATILSGTVIASDTVDFNNDLDMNAQPIVNIGNAGTDFGSDGGLTTAAGIGITAGNLTLTGGSIVDSNSAVTIADNAAVTGAADAVQLTVTGFTTQTNSLLVLEASGGADKLTVSNDGNVDAAGTINFGAANLYPLGYGSANQQIVCGTTTFTETEQVTPTGLTTVTYVIASQITTPAATGAFLTVSDPTTSTFTLSSWEADYSEGTTGVAAHWCAVGDQ